MGLPVVYTAGAVPTVTDARRAVGDNPTRAVYATVDLIEDYIAARDLLSGQNLQE